MTFGERISTFRKRKGLSQSELGKAAGSSGDLIGKYERDEVKPSIEVAGKIADVLEVSVDLLLGRTTQDFDKKNVKRLQEIEKLPKEDREHILYTIDSLIKAAKLKAI